MQDPGARARIRTRSFRWGVLGTALRPMSMHVCGCMHEPASITPSAGGLQGWESSGFVHMCSLGSRLPHGPEQVSGHCCCPSASGWWEEVLGVQKRAGPTLTIFPACRCLQAAMTPSSSWPCALATLVRGPATPLGQRGKAGASPPLCASHWPVCLPAVIQRTLHRIAHDTELPSVVTVAAVRVLRQTQPLFQAGGSGGPFAPHRAVVSTLALALSSSWAGAILARPGLAVRPASRNSAVPMQLPVPTTSAPLGWRRTEGVGGGLWREATRRVGGRGRSLKGVTVPTASEGVAMTNKNTDFSSQCRSSVWYLSPASFTLRETEGSGVLSEATQLVSGAVAHAHALERGCCCVGRAWTPRPHELRLCCSCPHCQVLPRLRAGVEKGTSLPRSEAGCVPWGRKVNLTPSLGGRGLHFDWVLTSLCGSTGAEQPLAPSCPQAPATG